MANLLDYLHWRGDLRFSVAPFNEIDNIILSMLSFIDFSDIVADTPDQRPVTLAECLAFNRKRYPEGENFGAVVPRENNALLEAAASCKRFADTYVACYRNEIHEENVMQFSAVTFILPDNSLFVAFRGTDDTLVGWKEDFAFSFENPTASQKASVEYLTTVAEAHHGAIRTGGHSKGGNLSVYSAAFAPKEVRDRIRTVYNNDGPGFLTEIIESDGYHDIADRIYTIVPQSSLIGMLLNQSCEYHVIESTAGNGAAQHNPYTWNVETTHFVRLNELSKQGRRHKEVLDEWINSGTADERRKLTDTIFTVLESAGAKTLSEMSEDGIKSLPTMLKSIAGLDKDMRDNALLFLKRLFEASKTDKDK